MTRMDRLLGNSPGNAVGSASSGDGKGMPKWNAESPPEVQVFDEDDDFNDMLSSLDLPSSFDPPILC